MSVIYDAGMLIAAERNNRHEWADHRVRLELGTIPMTTAPVVAQTSRSINQVQLRRLLRGCEIEALAPEEAHVVGALLGASNTTDVVDAQLAIVASAHGALVITSDDSDIEHLSAHLPEPLAVEHV